MPPNDALAALRCEFDQGFAHAQRSEAAARDYLLAVRVAGAPYALRVTEIAGLLADRVIVPLPSSVPAQLGLIGLRGQLLPVFDLGLLLGLRAQSQPRWLALLGEAQPVGLAFDAFEGQINLAPQDLVHRPNGAGSAVQQAEGLRPLIELPALLAEIRRQTTFPAPGEPSP